MHKRFIIGTVSLETEDGKSRKLVCINKAREVGEKKSQYKTDKPTSKATATIPRSETEAN